MKTSFWAAGMVAASSLAMAWASGAPAHGDDSSATVTSYSSTEWVTYTEPTPVPSNDKWPEGLRQVLRSATELVVDNRALLLGAYIDDHGSVVVVSGSSEGDALVGRVLPGVTIQRAPVSIASASSTGDELQKLSEGLAESIYEWGGEPQIDGMFVSIHTDLSESDQRLLEAFAAARRLHVRVDLNVGAKLPSRNVESRWHDTTPYVGGAAYGTTASDSSTSNPGYGCSFGFSYSTSNGDEFMLTAGHCVPKGDVHKYAWIYSGYQGFLSQYAGWRTTTTWEDGTGTVLTDDNQLHGDVALIKLPSTRNANARIWWDDIVDATETIPVAGRLTATVGDPTCINGRTSGSDCGTTVQNIGINVDYVSGETVRNVYKATGASQYDCSQDGDSGGSVILNHAGAETAADALGIVSGSGSLGGSSCNQYFTGVEEAREAWGGGLETSP